MACVKKHGSGKDIHISNGSSVRVPCHVPMLFGRAYAAVCLQGGSRHADNAVCIYVSVGSMVPSARSEGSNAGGHCVGKPDISG